MSPKRILLLKEVRDIICHIKDVLGVKPNTFGQSTTTL